MFYNILRLQKYLYTNYIYKGFVKSYRKQQLILITDWSFK